MGVSGNGHARSADLLAEALALRPALTDIMARQDLALERLAKPFETREEVEQWASNALRAAGGHSNEGLDDILGNTEFRVLVSTLLLDKSAAGEEYRARLRRVLNVVYGRALREIARSATEYLPGQGMGGGALHAPNRPTTYR